MKKILVVLMLLGCSIVQAQNKPVEVNLKVKCFPKEFLIKELISNFKETIVFAGIEESLNIEGVSSFLFWNSKTETYTFTLHLAKPDLVCVVANGSGSIVKEK